VYIETSIIGLLTARTPADVETAGRQRLTRRWWATRRLQFDLVTSQLTLGELSRGDPEAAAERREAARDLPLLDLTEETEQLAARLLPPGPLPVNAALDAGHIAVATVHGVRYLLTWNCRHIANASLRPRIERVCKVFGFMPPILCTPEELLDA
jgi:hypothetical protein